MSLPNCPKCGSEYTYEDGVLLVCPECAYEWEPGSEVEEGPVAIDANGNKLQDGDTVTVIKDLKIRLNDVYESYLKVSLAQLLSSCRSSSHEELLRFLRHFHPIIVLMLLRGDAFLVRRIRYGLQL